MKNLGHRFRSWLQRRSRSGVSPAAVLLREAPRTALRKLWGGMARALNEGVITPLNHRRYRAAIRGACGGSGENPCMVVAVPYLLHYVLPCLALALARSRVVVVLNGVRAWEERCLAQAFPDVPTIRLRTARGSMLSHGAVIELLLRHAEADLTLLDPDLFVFDTGLFDALRPADGEIAVGAFGFSNTRTGLEFPTTHLLGLRVAALRDVMRRHRIGPTIYSKTPRHLVAPLATLGLGDDNYVKDHLPYYDPLNLLLAMALHDGFLVRTLGAVDEQAFHVGGVSYLEDNAYVDYLNLRLLGLPWARPFAERYRRRICRSASEETGRARLVAQRAPHVAARVDALVERLAATTGARLQSTQARS